ncbi:hypothetical protein GTR02_19555 [Kineococcus sp. R8]|uniref:cell wall-binding repeat-containing protein n=1 Tax=Kineococcus siccus TaxID=2696567 RepID=UPI0014131E8E|nr:cell wall-binding repeat-containing protein [Kineococcus siccus]NAZ84008.1 hypothetical protein [Kineococcus siccus]
MRSARRSTLATAAITTLLGCGLAGAGSASAATPSPFPTITPKIGTPFPYIGLVRAAGEDRYGTAAVISQGSFAPSPGSSVFLTSGEAPADALTAGPAAASLDAPLLLTPAAALAPAAAAELTRLAPATVYVVGGADRVPEAVLTAVRSAAPGASVERIAGTTRYETAVAVAQRFFPDAEGVVVSRGDTFPDALSGGAAAAAAGVPLMITEPTALPAPVSTWLAGQTFDAALVVGGTSSVSESTAAAVAARVSDPADVTRVGGADRYATSALVATAVFADATTALIATGENFPDALAGVPAAAVNLAPILLVRPQCTPLPIFDYVASSAITSEIVLGGPDVVTADSLLTNCA